MEKKRRKIWFRPKEKPDFTCYRYRWHLFILDRYYNDKEVFLASTSKLKYIKEFILKEFSHWECLDIEVRLKLYALCKKKGTGEIFKVSYDIFCEEEED